MTMRKAVTGFVQLAPTVPGIAASPLLAFLIPGLLFRFNREYYQLDERGRPAGYRNLDKLHERIKPYMLRRRKTEVETELPERPIAEPRRLGGSRPIAVVHWSSR